MTINERDLIVAEPLLQIDTQLGEGPLYDQQHDTLHFVDVYVRPPAVKASIDFLDVQRS